MGNSWEESLHQIIERKGNLKILRLNFVNSYNHDMNSVDRADHLRKTTLWDKTLGRESGGGVYFCGHSMLHL